MAENPIPNPQPARPPSNHAWTLPLLVFELVVLFAFCAWMQA